MARKPTPSPKPPLKKEAKREKVKESLGALVGQYAREVVSIISSGKGFRFVRGTFRAKIDLSEIDKHLFGDLEKGTVILEIEGELIGKEERDEELPRPNNLNSKASPSSS